MPNGIDEGRALGIVSNTETPPDSSGDDAAKRRYKARCDRALATIVLTIDPSLLYLIGEPKDPVKLWTTLEGHFQKNTWANKLVLRRKLHSL